MASTEIINGVNHPSFLSHFKRTSDDDYAVQLDHCYAKPWSASTETFTGAQPACLLFMSRFSKSNEKDTSTGDLDVVSVNSSTVPPYDQEKARQLMTECERNINFARSDEILDEEWEEKLNREGWSMTQTRLFNRIVKTLQSDRLARLTFAGQANEPILMRLCIDKTAKRVRQALAGAGWDLTLTRWLHSTLISVLGQSALAAYLDVLQTISSKAPSQVAAMVGWKDGEPVDKSTVGGLKLLLKRPWDPVASFVALHQLNPLPKDPIIVVVPDLPADLPRSPAAMKRSKFWSSQLSMLGKVVHLSVDCSTSSATQFVSAIESALITKCNHLHEKHPQRPIILIGWQIGAIIACQLQCVVPTAAVVALGFPTEYLKGSFIDAEELLVGSKVPVLFVVGQNATTCCIDSLEDMREEINAASSLVIVGGCDDRLRMSHGRRRIEEVTQSMVDRCIFDKISEFLNDILSYVPTQTVDNANKSESEPHIKCVKSATSSSSRMSNLFDPLAGGDTQALLMQPTDLHSPQRKRHHEIKRRKKTAKPVAEVFVSEGSTPFMLGRQLSSNVRHSPIMFTQSASQQTLSGALRQMHNSSQIYGATPAIRERLKKTSSLSTSLNISVGSMSSSVSAQETGLSRPSTSHIQQLLVNTAGRSAVYQPAETESQRFWTFHPSLISSGQAAATLQRSQLFGARITSMSSSVDRSSLPQEFTSLTSGFGNRPATSPNLSYIARPTTAAASTSTRTRTIKTPKHYDI